MPEAVVARGIAFGNYLFIGAILVMEHLSPEQLLLEQLSPELLLFGEQLSSEQLSPPYGAVVVGAIIVGAITAGTFIVGAIIAEALSRGAIVVGVTFAGANVAGVNFAGAFVEEHLSRSNCRLQRSKCGRSNNRRSICRIAVFECTLFVIYAISLKYCIQGTCIHVHV